ncbi:MAG: BolA family transcriptional regulator [Hyphomicrobiales bacterium]|nr:BolA family transcriptional regulator [Hyphomicrobiales bacterium]
MTVQSVLTAKLTEALAPQSLEVIDESDRHASHHTHPGGAGHQGETHFRVRIVSPAFQGMTRLQRHRRINEIVAAELAAGVHALAIDARAPGE